MADTYLFCAWCHRLNLLVAIGPTFCSDPMCAHEIGKPRLFCGCQRCAATRTLTPVRPARRRKAAKIRWGDWRGLPGSDPAE